MLLIILVGNFFDNDLIIVEKNKLLKYYIMK